MRKDKSKALKLRLKGKSYNEIHKELGVPKGTLSGWFDGLLLSPAAQNRIKNRVARSTYNTLIKRNKRQTEAAVRRMRVIKNAALHEIQKISPAELKMLGISLYWAEGYKRPVIVNGKERTYHSVALSNSDPRLIKIFVRFLREICHVNNDHITASLRIYEHMNENTLINFWQSITELPKSNFRKTYYGVSLSSQHKRPYNRLEFGTLQIRVNDTKLFHTIIGWIEGVAKFA